MQQEDGTLLAGVAENMTELGRIKIELKMKLLAFLEMLQKYSFANGHIVFEQSYIYDVYIKMYTDGYRALATDNYPRMINALANLEKNMKFVETE